MKEIKIERDSTYKIVCDSLNVEFNIKVKMSGEVEISNPGLRGNISIIPEYSNQIKIKFENR